MTDIDIIAMAREVGFDVEPNEWHWLERFAALVAAAEREQIAQIIEDASALVEFAQNEHGGCLMCGFTPKIAAQFIRARGETK